jgi:hypothetical protein
MAFKMKAGKEGPMYKNYGIGKDSPMHIQPPGTRKVARGPKVGVDDVKQNPLPKPKKSAMTFEKGDTTYDGYRVHSTGYNPLDTEARKRKVHRENPDATDREINNQLGRRKYQNYTADDERQYIKDSKEEIRKNVAEKKKAEFMEKKKAELEADPAKAKYMAQKHKEYMARSNK